MRGSLNSWNQSWIKSSRLRLLSNLKLNTMNEPIPARSYLATVPNPLHEEYLGCHSQSPPGGNPFSSTRHLWIRRSSHCPFALQPKPGWVWGESPPKPWMSSNRDSITPPQFWVFPRNIAPNSAPPIAWNDWTRKSVGENGWSASFPTENQVFVSLAPFSSNPMRSGWERNTWIWLITLSGNKPVANWRHSKR